MNAGSNTAAGTHDGSGRFDRESVAAAVAVAVRAPSIHNTQPWRWRLDDDGLALLAARDRQLAVADPDGHSLLISCGAALHLTDLALRAAGWQTQVTRLPNPSDPDLLAMLRPVGRTEPDPGIADEVDAALRRRSDRRPFAPEQLSDDTIEALRTAAAVGDVRADFPVQEDQRINLAVAVSWADRVERHDAAYIAEMRRWLTDPEVHASADGVPLDAVPHVPADSPRHTDVPLRDFEVGVTGQQLIERDVDERPLIAVVFSDANTAGEALRAGESMMRLMVRAELLGLATCPLSQAVDLAAFRTRVQSLMGWVGYPQMMLRIGYPTSSLAELPPTPRRGPNDVLEVV